MSDTPVRPASAVTSRITLSVTCPRCGASLSTSLTLCSKCGAVLSDASTTASAAAAAEQTEKLRARLQESIGDAFELMELLGRGGMGIVFRAKERALDREVALKVLALDPVFAPEAYARFEREAKLAAKLDHPNIVPIFAVGHRESVAYYTMRLVRGGTLESMLGKKPLEVDYCVRVLRDVAAALDHAHRQGVVHRDIKPANVLLGESGHAMVADFGIAKALGNTTGNATGTGIIGSPAYMSPEQWRGDELDGRADQYALAVVAFEMLSGTRPFETARVEDLLTMHLSAEMPDITAIRPGLPASTDAALRRALAKSASERFSTVTGFVEALAGRRPAGPSPTTARGPRYVPKPKSGGFPWKVTIVAAALAGIIAGVPPIRRQALEFWGGLLHATTLIREEAERLGTPGAAAQPVVSAAQRDSVVATDTVAAFDSLATRDTAVSVPPELERAPLVLDDSVPSAPVGGPAPFRVTGARHGWIRVVVNGGTAPIIIDGRSYGSAPQTIRVERGSHIVSVRGAGDLFMPFQHDLVVAENDTVLALFEVPVRRQPPPPQPEPAADTMRPVTAPPADSAAQRPPPR